MRSSIILSATFFLALFLYQCTSDGGEAPTVPTTKATESTSEVEPTRKLETSSVYRVAIGYNQFEEEALEQGSDDWAYYSNEAMEATQDLGVVFLYPETEELQEVEILNAEGKKVATENVQGFFDENGAGYVLMEEGRDPVFVEYSPEMGASIRAYFEQ